MTIKLETKCYWEDSGGGTMLTDQDMNRSWERQRSFEPFFIWKQKMRSNWNCFVYCGCMQERSCNKDYCGGISCEGLLVENQENVAVAAPTAASVSLWRAAKQKNLKLQRTILLDLR